MIHVHLQECSSTQDELISRIHLFNPNPLLITTENQHLGRGRRGKTWTFYPDSLAFSFALQPLGLIPLTCLEMGILCCEYMGRGVKLKWPNDLMLEGKKCGGILCQLVGQWVVVGVGINISTICISKDFNRTSIPLPEDQKRQKIWPRGFYEFVLQNRISHDHSLVERFENYCDHLNQIVHTERGERGIFTGLGENGEAIIVTDDQTEHKIVNGSLFYN